MENVYVNEESGKRYATHLKSGQRTYKRNIGQRHFCFRHEGFGLQYTLFQDLVSRGFEKVEFTVESTVYSGVDKRGRDIVAAVRGKYTISLDDMARHGIVDTLSASSGEQIFVNKIFCSFVGG